MARTNKRAESRARYFVRKVAQERGWDMRHPQNGGDCLEEQEVMAFFPQMVYGMNSHQKAMC